MLSVDFLMRYHFSLPSCSATTLLTLNLIQNEERTEIEIFNKKRKVESIELTNRTKAKQQEMSADSVAWFKALPIPHQRVGRLFLGNLEECSSGVVISTSRLISRNL